MGNTLSTKLPPSWNDENVIKWAKNAYAVQQSIYLQFEGSQFHDMEDLSRELRISKICYAIYGTPSEYVDTLEEAYSKEQRAFASKIYEKIYETFKKAPEKRFELGFVFVLCKEGEKEYQVPLFRLLWDRDSDTSRYIDTACRVYKSVEDWKNNNSLPRVKYCFPQRLCYTCDASGAYKFDPEDKTVVEFGNSPACKVSHRIARTTDVVTAVVATTVGVATILTPAGFISLPILLGTAGTAGLWGVGRVIQRVADKIGHAENFDNFESVLLILTLVAAPLHVLSGLATAQLAAGATAGEIFSETERILATVLTLTTFGVDGFTFVLSVTNLIDKLRNGRLTSLDVLQFSISLFFFTNTLMQPKTAWGVIERAQEQRIADIAHSLTDAEAKKAFQLYLEQNKGDGSIKDTSRLVRELNRMENPDSFFRSFKNVESANVPVTEGETPNLASGGGGAIRAPNDRIAYSLRLKRDLPTVAKALLGEAMQGDSRSHKYLEKSKRDQIGPMEVFDGAVNNNKTIAEYAERLADKMGKKMDPDKLKYFVGAVAAKVKAIANVNFNDNATFDKFHAEISKDLDVIRKIAAEKNLKLANEFLALYHFENHGEEFIKLCSPEFYLDISPQDILKNAKLYSAQEIISVAQNGSRDLFIRKTYFSPDDRILVMIEKEGLKSVSTMFEKIEEWAKFMDGHLVTSTPPMTFAFEKLARITGLDSQLKLSRESDMTEFSKSKLYKRMVAILVTYLCDYLKPYSVTDDEDEECHTLVYHRDL